VGLVAGGLLVACLILIYVVWPLLRWLFWKHWRRTLFGLACLATLIALFYAEEDWRGKHDWEKFKREWEAKGEHFDYASVIPPPVPDDQNFALTPIVASCYEYILDKNGHKLEKQNTNVVNRLAISREGSAGDWKNWPTNGYWLRQTITDLRGWQQFYRVLATRTNLFQIPTQPQSPAQDVLLALSKYDSIIEELRQASLLPDSRFPLNYDSDHPFATLLPHLATMKRLSQVLQLRAIAELQAGEADRALADVKLSFRLIESFRTEPFLISELVRIAMFEIALQPIYEGLAEHRWSDEQLVALDAELAKLDFLADYQSSMRGERAMTCATIDFLSKKNTYQRYRELFNSVNSEAGDDGGVTLWGQLNNKAKMVGIYLMPAGWFTQNKLFIARGEQGWITGVIFPEKHLASPQKYREVEQAESLSIYTSSAKPWNFLAKEFYPALGASGRKSSREQISVDLARTAIALERYRLAHGEYPESLDALVPQFIAQVPHDVIGGQPLKYRREADGQFILYSVGWNETDDGGVIGHHNGGVAPYFEAGDWVWRYPQQE
jgi:tetratricopeptide (TPR) repeat protein